MGKKRAEVKEKNPGLSTGEIAKLLGSMWKSLSTEDRKEYDEEAKRKREEYDVVYAEYAKNKPPSEYETDDSDAGAQGKGKERRKALIRIHRNVHYPLTCFMLPRIVKQ